MGLLSRWLQQATVLHVQQWRTCPDCRGLGFGISAARAPDGSVPIMHGTKAKRLLLKIQCGRCKGAGKFLVNEEWREGLRPVQTREYRR